LIEFNERDYRNLTQLKIITLTIHTTQQVLICLLHQLSQDYVSSTRNK